jgi:predicted dehydrogenase
MRRCRGERSKSTSRLDGGGHAGQVASRDAGQGSISMTDFAWAIVGPGRIAHRFADAVYRLPGTCLRSVLGRDPGRTAEFVAHWSRAGKPPPRAVTDIGTLLRDPAIDAVYVATPHSSHAEFVRQCLLACKPVLCEKPLVPSVAQARELVALSRERRVFLMEGLWTRFLPLYARVSEWLGSGVIGRVQAIQSSFCFRPPYDPNSRLFRPDLAGGSLLDIGIYNVAVTRWVLESALGACPEPVDLRVEGTRAPTGVDQRATGTITFPGGVVSQFVCALDGTADNSLRIFGDEGWIRVEPRFWQATEAVLCRRDQPPETLQAPFRVNGLEGEIEETVRCVRAGLTESPQMPLAETLAIAGWLDECRRQLGVRYPFEGEDPDPQP